MRAPILAFWLSLAAATALAAAPATSANPSMAVPKPAAHKPETVKSAEPKTAKPKAGPFYATDPADIIALFASMGAKASTDHVEDGMVFLNVEVPGQNFNVQMIGCDPKGKACHAMAVYTVFDKSGVTLAQINDFNRSQFACRGLLTPDGHPSVMYAALVDARLNQDQTKAHLGVWQGCLKGFGEFVADPVEFLSKPHG